MAAGGGSISTGISRLGRMRGEGRGGRVREILSIIFNRALTTEREKKNVDYMYFVIFFLFFHLHVSPSHPLTPSEPRRVNERRRLSRRKYFPGGTSPHPHPHSYRRPGRKRESTDN